MRIGSTGYPSKDGGINDYELFAKHGFDCEDYQGLAQIKDEPMTLPEEEFTAYLKKVREAANKAGITFYQTHSPWPCPNETYELRLVGMEWMKKAVRGSAILGAEYMIVHPLMTNTSREDDPAFEERLNVEFFTELCAYAKEYNVGIALENMPFLNINMAPMRHIVAFVEKYNIPNLYICLDTGHSHCHDEDVSEMVRLCGDHLKALHIHDNMWHMDLHLLPYCGSIDWSGFNQALKDVHFTGVVNLECGVRPYMPEPMLEKARLALVEVAKDFARE